MFHLYNRKGNQDNINNTSSSTYSEYQTLRSKSYFVYNTCTLHIISSPSYAMYFFNLTYGFGDSVVFCLSHARVYKGTK